MVRYSLSCMTLSFTTPRRFIPTHHKADPSMKPGRVKENPVVIVWLEVCGLIQRCDEGSFWATSF